MGTPLLQLNSTNGTLKHRSSQCSQMLMAELDLSALCNDNDCNGKRGFYILPREYGIQERGWEGMYTLSSSSRKEEVQSTKSTRVCIRA